MEHHAWRVLVKTREGFVAMKSMRTKRAKEQKISLPCTISLAPLTQRTPSSLLHWTWLMNKENYFSMSLSSTSTLHAHESENERTHLNPLVTGTAAASLTPAVASQSPPPPPYPLPPSRSSPARSSPSRSSWMQSAASDSAAFHASKSSARDVFANIPYVPITLSDCSTRTPVSLRELDAVDTTATACNSGDGGQGPAFFYEEDDVWLTFPFVARFNTHCRLVLFEDGTAVIDRSARCPPPALGATLLAFQKMSATLSCDAKGCVTLTTPLWRDSELGVCETHTFVQLARAFCGLGRRW